VTGRPTLVVVSGPPGAGKTTLAHAIGRAVGCPVVCRDEIKEGMAHATPGFVAGPSDPLTMRTLPVFFDTLRLLLNAGVTTVAEAAFQDRLWRPGLEPLLSLARLRIIQCHVDPAVAARRMDERQRPAHADAQWSVASFERIALPVPEIGVDTTDGYQPDLGAVVAFVNDQKNSSSRR
jgi:predicted kinase